MKPINWLGRSLSLGRYEPRVARRLDALVKDDFLKRLWERDTTLWSPDPPPGLADRLGWLDLPGALGDIAEDLEQLAREIRREGVRHVVLLGMGGSSLAAEVFASAFGPASGYPELLVADSTHPDSVRRTLSAIDPRATVVVVSSKSGATVETLGLLRCVHAEIERATGEPGRQFVAITDRGSPLEALARDRAFRRTFTPPSDVGGRYSALSVFGLLPAALIGVDLVDLAEPVRSAARRYDLGKPEHSGSPRRVTAGASRMRQSGLLAIGAAMGELTLAGRDKMTFLTSPSLTAFPAWLEQLVAESTGKQGRGVVPIVGEPFARPERYGADRFFVQISLEGEEDAVDEARLAALEACGHPVARIRLGHRLHLCGEMFHWEVATVCACAVLGVNPFDQPDVETSKHLAREAMARPDQGVGSRNRGSAPAVRADDGGALARAVGALLDRGKPGDYVAIQAYLAPSDEITAALQDVRSRITEKTALATTLGYGPRFLHSTGQLHKGGADNGIFLQLVDEPRADLHIPNTAYTFGDLIAAQSMGDLRALAERGRRVLRVNLGQDPLHGLGALLDAV